MLRVDNSICRPHQPIYGDCPHCGGQGEVRLFGSISPLEPAEEQKKLRRIAIHKHLKFVYDWYRELSTGLDFTALREIVRDIKKHHGEIYCPMCDGRKRVEIW